VFTANTPGNANYTASSTSLTLQISKATPTLTLSVPSSYAYDGSGGPIKYSISTFNNQVIATFMLNGQTIATTTTSNTYTTSNAISTYSAVLTSASNANYISKSINASFAITSQSSGGGGSGGSGGTGGSGGSGGGGSGGSQKPVIITLGSNCYYISNIASLNTFRVSFSSEFINVTDNFITPNYTGATINGASYSLYPQYKVPITGATAYVILENISYVPILQTVALEICSTLTGVTITAPVTTTTTINATSTTTIPGTGGGGGVTSSPTTSITPTNATTTIQKPASTTTMAGNGVFGYLGSALALNNFVSAIPSPARPWIAPIIVVIIIAAVALYLIRRRKPPEQPPPTAGEVRIESWTPPTPETKPPEEFQTPPKMPEVPMDEINKIENERQEEETEKQNGEQKESEPQENQEEQEPQPDSVDQDKFP
jgi:hypothetical protein